MNITRFIEESASLELAPYKPDSRIEGVAFAGLLRKHPYDEAKCLLIADPTGCEPAILEFRVEDVLGADEMPVPVDEQGKNLKLMKLWIRKGSFGIRYESFEVGSPLRKPGDGATELHEHLLKTVRCP
jgi:inorganic pyrophosphatase